ncbi:hypothetical protein K458DRAFT_436356 [Lentithecium fluviatile CBS 122367]|uniref:Uncharacterized protein n=1 Tax=Lentithecium fluviatile CBS 122367 TaxID=1168545 RepID=A0A6G1II99_9PLEO|nr:hypothetical protein K458DRAFT_436356 [Lentithecium fluviatile CBS 122367]
MLQARAKPSEARAHSKLSQEQWEEFYHCTKVEANNLNGCAWLHVQADVRTEIRARVNSYLRNKGIPTVGDDVIGWRMKIALRDTKHTARGSKQSEGEPPSANLKDATARPLLPAAPVDDSRGAGAGAEDGNQRSAV